MRSYLICLVFIFTCLYCRAVNAASFEPLWISPTNVNTTYDVDIIEILPMEKGVWSTIDIGVGARGFVPLVELDSKGTLWIMGGVRNGDGSQTLYNMWNYNPKTDQYRYVWGNSTTAAKDPRNAGDLGVPSETNHPGGIIYVTSTIDASDNIWFLSLDYYGELWMFNTTSWMFTRMFGLYGQTSEPSMGSDPGNPGPDVWPGLVVGACMQVDPSGNIWLVSGENFLGYTNPVWMFNTSAMLWTFVYGSITEIKAKHNSTFFGGTWGAGCFMNDLGQIWLYGGVGIDDTGAPDNYGSIWIFDTKTKEYRLEYGASTFIINANVVSEDYHPDNHPGASAYASLVDRLDGTLMLVGGQMYNSGGRLVTMDTVWLYSLDLKQWKLVHGDASQDNAEDVIAPYVNYRQPGSLFPGAYYAGHSNSKNVKGEVYLVGGIRHALPTTRKDIWFIPNDQCNTSKPCDVNAYCVEELFGYSCVCNDGYVGDGHTCTVPLPVSPPSSSNAPSVTPITSGAPVTVTPTKKTSGGAAETSASIVVIIALAVLLTL